MSGRRQWILDQLLEDADQTILYEPADLDTAIIGLSTYQAGRPSVPCVVYSYQRLLRAFIKQGMSPDEAEEWIDYNVVGGWLGDGTPIVVVEMPAGVRK